MRSKAKFLSVKDTTISFLDFVRKFSTEYKAFVYLEKVRWSEGIVCPYCGEKIIYNCNRKEGRGYHECSIGTHGIVTHSQSEYVKGDFSTNEIESVWAILKRGWKGIYHHMSPKHLQLYVNEYCFRLNDGRCEKHLDDRIKSLCGFAFGSSHMTYKQLVSKVGDNLLMRVA